MEVKLRIREPVGGAQCEFQEMKWLVIGRSGRAPTNPQPSLSGVCIDLPPLLASDNPPTYTMLQVLQAEINSNTVSVPSTIITQFGHSVLLILITD